MAIKFKCKCGKEFQTGEANAGKKIKCKECGTVLKVPTPKAVKAGPVGGGDEFNFGDLSRFDEEDVVLPSGPAIPPPVIGMARTKSRVMRPDLTLEGEDAELVAEGKAAQKKDGEKKNSAQTLGMALVGVIGVVVGGGFGYYVVTNLVIGGPIEPPTEFVEYTGVDNAFAIEYPKDWELTDSKDSVQADPWARFESGNFTISVKTGVGAAQSIMAIGDAMSSIGGEEIDPSTAFHQSYADQLALDYSSYEEDPVQYIETNAGRLPYSKFESRGAFGSREIGYRMSMASGGVGNTVIYCKCAKDREFEAMADTFKKVMKSFGGGGGDDLMGF